MRKKNKPTREDIIYKQNEKMKSQEDMINFLKQQLEVAYDVNQRLQEELESKSDNMDEESYRNLTQLNTLLMVLMNLIIPHCDDSPLGQVVGKAIKKYNITMAKSLVNDTVFIKEKDKDYWKDDDEEDYREEDNEWNGEEY